jgi:hypothetical protein
MLDDLAKTLCVNAGVDGDCSAYNGYDLLAGEFEGIGASKVTMFIVKDSESDSSYDKLDAITISRGSDIIESLHVRLASDALGASVACGSRIDVTSGEKVENGRSDLQSWLTWIDRGASFLLFKQEGPCTAARLLIEDQPGVKEVTILINGQIIESAESAAAVPDGLLVDLSSRLSQASGDVLIEVRPDGRTADGVVLIRGIEFDEPS